VSTASFTSASLSSLSGMGGAVDAPHSLRTASSLTSSGGGPSKRIGDALFAAFHVLTTWMTVSSNPRVEATTGTHRTLLGISTLAAHASKSRRSGRDGGRFPPSSNERRTALLEN
jgi:hypothetical protein